jgi:sulfoxide reductase catalytic subunit YedY
MLIRTPPPWQLPEAAVTDQATWLNRRAAVRALGLGAMSLAAIGCESTPPAAAAPGPWDDHYPAARNPAYAVTRPLTAPRVAARFNNFYEFTADKADVHRQTGAFHVHPWRLEVTGLCAKPTTFDLDDLLRQHRLEERVYRFRCVEAWAMVVPWTGFMLKDLLARVEPAAEARYLRLWTVNRPEEMPGQTAQHWYPWPYYEALRIDEAMHPLALMATGIYGRPLPTQHGAPIRLVVPWKYGFKSIKSVVKIELVARRPGTFWNALVPQEYDFWGNVDPTVPHPRWSQASERLIGRGDRVPTLRYNGYPSVAGLYAKG